MSTRMYAMDTLRREHRVASGLLGRLKEIGERMRKGDPVSPRSVRFGVGLLDAYLHRVHARQFDVELWPEAFSAAGPDCRPLLGVIRFRHLEMRGSVREILALISRWARGDAGAREQIAEALIGLAASDSAANRFEEQYPFPCLVASLPEATRARLASQFAEHLGTKGALEVNISRFLETSRVR